MTPTRTHTPDTRPRTRAQLFARTLALSLASVLIAGCASSSRVESAPLPIPQERVDEHVASFDYVWEAVRDRHWDPELNGADWEGAREDLRPRVVAATSDGEARAAMTALIGRLGQSHFAIIPSEAYERYEDVRSGDDEPVADADEGGADRPDGWSGLEARLRDGRALITRVHEDSPADEAGIRAGWHIERFGRVGADVLIEIAGQASGVERPETTAALIFTSRLAGNVGSTLELTVRDGSETASVVSLELAPAPGELASLGNLPPLPVVVETRTLDDGVGYFRINVFFDPPRVLSAYRAFLAEHADAPGIVIDMRGNLGGIILMASGMMNFLIDESGLKLGEMTLRDPERGPFAMPIMLNPRGSTYDGKVAVLIDEQSISNAEILAAGLQDIGRARLFGTRTAGLVLPSTVDLLPNGDGFQFAFASYVSSSGRPLEGVGAAPDVAVQETAQGLLAGVDGPLDAALDWILGGE